MALPAGIPTVAVSIGPFTDQQQGPGVWRGGVVFTPSRARTHLPTGTVLTDEPIHVPVESSVGSVVLVASDAPDMDVQGSVTYRVDYHLAGPRGRVAIPSKTITLPAAAPQVDLDLLTSTTQQGLTVSLPQVLSVAGLSGAVGAEALAAALRAFLSIPDSSGLAPQARRLTAGFGVTGGGDLTADREFAADTSVMATRAYVEAVAAGKTVRAATTQALDGTYSGGVLTASANGALACDGVALAAGNRVLVKDQAAAQHNGLYTVTNAGSASTRWVLTRATEMDADGEIPGAYTFVSEGSTQAATGWVVTGAGPFTVGVTPIVWSRITAGTAPHTHAPIPESDLDPAVVAKLAAALAAAPATREIAAGFGVTGGGDLTQNRLFGVDTGVIATRAYAESLVGSTSSYVIDVAKYGARADCKSITGSVSAGSTTFTASTAVFQPSDVGKTLIVPGAGAGGADLFTVVDERLSGTQVRLLQAAGASVSAASCTLGTDNGDAFAAAYQEAVAARRSWLAGFNNYRGGVQIRFGGGAYLNTKPRALMDASGIGRTAGLMYIGNGQDTTEIVHYPSTPNAPLLYNNDVWLDVVFMDLSVLSVYNRTDGGAPTFCYSYSTGGAQQWYFFRFRIGGYWEWGAEKVGSDCNSEWKHYACRFQARFEQGWIYSHLTTDQDVNTDFFGCDVILLWGGRWVRADKGGAYRFWGGQIILDRGALGWDMRGTVHSRGAESLVVDGTRVELRLTSTPTKLINCEWGRGNVSFRHVSEETLTQTNPGTITHTYNPGNSAGPTVHYQDCSFAKNSAHEYVTSTGTWGAKRCVTYTSCVMDREPHEFIVFTQASGQVDNRGGRPAIDFRSCRFEVGTNPHAVVRDCTLGWEHSYASQPQQRVAMFRTAQGSMGNSGTVLVTLPMGAIVTGFRWHKEPQAGGSTAVNWRYDVTTSDTVPVTLSTLAPGTSWAAGWSVASSPLPGPHFVCNTDARRKLQLTFTNAPVAPVGANQWVAVEYLG